MKVHAIEPDFVADIAKFAELKNKLVAKRSEYVGFRDFYNRRVKEIDGQLAQAGVYLTDVCSEAAELPSQPATVNAPEQPEAKEIRFRRASAKSQMFVVLQSTIGDRTKGMTISEIVDEVRKTMPYAPFSSVRLGVHHWKNQGIIERVNRTYHCGRYILAVPVKLVFDKY